MLVPLLACEPSPPVGSTASSSSSVRHGSIIGRVLDPEGAALSPGSDVWVKLLYGEHRSPGPGDYLDGASLARGGELEFRSLEPGKYTVVVYQGLGFVSDPIEVEPGQQAEIALQMPGQAMLKISVLDARGEPLREARVHVEHLDWGTTRGWSTDENGRLQISGMAAGRYRASVRAAESIAWEHRFEIDDEVRELSLDLRAPSDEQTRWSARLVDGDSPVANEEIRVSSLVDNGRVSVGSDASGGVPIIGLMPGPAWVSIPDLKAGFEVMLPEDASPELVWSLPSGEIRGRIDAPRPSAEASVHLFLCASATGVSSMGGARPVPIDRALGFRIGNLSAGEYALYCISGGYRSATGIRFFSAVESASLIHVSLEQAMPRDIGSIRLGTQATGRVTCELRDATGRRVHDPMTWPLITTEDGIVLPQLVLPPRLSGEEMEREAELFERGSASFEGWLPVGRYTAHLFSLDYAARPVSFEVRPQGDEQVTLPVEVGGDLRIRVVGAEELPVAGVLVSLQDEKGASMVLPTYAVPTAAVQPRTDSTGELVLHNLPAGDYRPVLRLGDRTVAVTESVTVEPGRLVERSVAFE